MGHVPAFARLLRPGRQLVPAGLARPGITLLDHTARGVEAEERGSGDRLHESVLRRDRPPPVDRGAIAVDHRLAEPAVGCGLVAERPRDVLPRCLSRAKRVRVEDRIVRVEGNDRLDVSGGPRLRPDGDPRSCGGLCVYLATSIARDSRMTMTFTCPGYSS
jgi:hypothetical protein